MLKPHRLRLGAKASETFSMKVLTAQEMASTDRRSVEAGVSIRVLMENAGAAVARFCQRYYHGPGLVVVLCGKGNNGGDGLVAARHLATAGRPVRVLLTGAQDAVQGEAGEALRAAAAQAGVEVWAVDSSQDDPQAAQTLIDAAFAGASLFIDAIVGTGFKPPLRGVAAVLRDRLATSKIPIVAVDLPSGWDADSPAQTASEPQEPAGENGPVTSTPQSEAIRADAVVTFALPKLAHVFGQLTPGETFGAVVVAGIDTPEQALASAGDLHWAGSALASAQVPRDSNGNKGKFGHALVVGGAFGKSGAPAMASLAALRTGAGLVTAAVAREIVPAVAAITPELMTVPLPGSEDGGLSLDTLAGEPFAKLLKGITVVALGPGLGQAGSTPEFVRNFLARCELPLVLDADALNALAGQTGLLREATEAARAKGQPRTIVLTPHPGEMGRLAGLTVKQVEADRVGLARRFATGHGVTLVLKGWRTLIAHPDGRVAVNTTGNPGMAKGGSGDILTGIVAAMLAQYKQDVAQAVEAAVFLHGLAGDFATLATEEHTVLATDTIHHLWRAFRMPVEDADGFTWVAGLAARPAAQESR